MEAHLTVDARTEFLPNVIRAGTVFVPVVEPEDLTPTMDIFGHRLAPGVRVRSFDHCRRDASGGLEGLDVDSGRVCYIEGILEAIGVKIALEPGLRYRIKVLRRVTTPDGGGEPQVRRPETEFVYPLLNGSHLMEFGPSFGVVRLLDEAA
jgi:hypothetical protein